MVGAVVPDYVPICGGTNYIVEYCYDHQVATSEDTVPSIHSSDFPLTISAEEYQWFMSFQHSSVGSSSGATLAQTTSSVACVAYLRLLF